MAEHKTTKTETKDSADRASTFDFATLLGPYNLAGVDFSKILARERKNISALTEANKIVFAGWQALLRRQSEIFQETMAQTIAGARKQTDLNSRAEFAKDGFEKALDNMREIATMAAKYQQEAFGVVHKRVSEQLEEFHNPDTRARPDSD